MKTKVMLVDDHQIVREGLRSLIEKNGDMEVVGEAGDGRTAISLSSKLQPQVVLMDVSMPELNGIEATRQLLKKYPQVKVLGLSVHVRKSYVSDMLQAGASGYMLKNCTFHELTKAINAVMEDHMYLSPSLTDVMLDEYINFQTDKSFTTCPVLSPREREVLQLLAEGKSTKQIALVLHVSAKTIATHREHIMNKLDIHNIVDLTKYAIREGLTCFEI